MSVGKFGIGLWVEVLNDLTISGIEDWADVLAGGIRHSIMLHNSSLHLRAFGFSSENEAKQYLPRLACGLWGLMLADRIAFNPCFDAAVAIRPDDPEEAARNLYGKSEKTPQRLDLCLLGEGYYVFQKGDVIVQGSGGRPNVSVSSDWETCEPSFQSGIICHNPNAGFEDRDIGTALSLCASQYFETSIRAKFIMLISALEVLAPSLRRHDTVVSAFDRLEADFRSLLILSNCPEERESLKSAIEDTKWKRNESVSHGIKVLIGSIDYECEAERKSKIKGVVRAYGIRSKLLHEGRVDDHELSEAVVATKDALKSIIFQRLGVTLHR